MTYDIVLVDPPWRFRTWSETNQHRSAKQHYELLNLEDLKSLRVEEILSPDGALFLWVIRPMLPQALEVVTAWGLEFRTVAFTWVKYNHETGKFPIGLGYYTRANPEQCWLVAHPRGKPKRQRKDIPELVLSPRLRHSAKPPEVRERIVQMMGDRPRIELFARDCAEGWEATGLEYDGLDIRDALECLITGGQMEATR